MPHVGVSSSPNSEAQAFSLALARSALACATEPVRPRLPGRDRMAPMTRLDEDPEIRRPNGPGVVSHKTVSSRGLIPLAGFKCITFWAKVLQESP